MTPLANAGWAARVASAGVRLDLLKRDLGSRDADVLAESILRAARDGALCDRDLYPLLVQAWIGRPPPIDWPPKAFEVARRCATALAAQQPCDFGFSSRAPSERALQQAREAIVRELDLVPQQLLAVLSDRWPELARSGMPRDGKQSLLAFAQHVLLEPVAGACALIWSTLQPPPGDLADWEAWSLLARGDWRAVVEAELRLLGDDERVPDDVGRADGLLAGRRARALEAGATPALVAASMVRTSGWPGSEEIAVGLAARALDLAMGYLADLDPHTDNDAIVDAIVIELTPGADTLVQWARDSSFGRLEVPGGSAQTGADMLQLAARWLAWSFTGAAVDVVVAMRQAPATRS